MTPRASTAVAALWLGAIAAPVASAQERGQEAHLEEGRKSVYGAELYYKIMGSGEPIVVLHGGPGLEHTYLLPQMGILAKSFKLIFYDQRTTGGSVNDTEPSSITLETFVDDLEGIRKAFDLDKMNLLGHSWGGMLAMFYALEYPENLNSLMLISSGGARSDFWNDLYSNVERKRTPEDSLALAEMSVSADLNEMEAWGRYMKVFFRSYFYDQRLGDQLNMKVSDTTLRNRRLLASTPLGQAVRDYNIVDQLSKVRIPTLVLHGVSDVIPLEYAEEIHENIEGSVFVVLEQCGHFPYIEKPDEFFDAVDTFMNELSRR